VWCRVTLPTQNRLYSSAVDDDNIRRNRTLDSQCRGEAVAEAVRRVSARQLKRLRLRRYHPPPHQVPSAMSCRRRPPTHCARCSKIRQPCAAHTSTHNDVSHTVSRAAHARSSICDSSVCALTCSLLSTCLPSLCSEQNCREVRAVGVNKLLVEIKANSYNRGYAVRGRERELKGY
jgi:hypothetical protein